MRIGDLLRSLRLWLHRLRIKKTNVSIICNNCLGGVLYHDYKMKFCSPFINLMIPTSHFIDLIQNIDSIKQMELIDITSHDNRYPVGLLNSKYELHFMHYDSFQEAKKKWIERVERINYENLYVILVETHSCTYKDLEIFDNLPFKNKIIVTHKPYPSIKSAVPIKDYDGINLNRKILWPMNRWGKRKYDQIDWLSFLNLR